ncbi:hypothetical protein AZA_49698 [Nitrospirillum viridazoti Y2]|nr:hypothetical protein AZA_49698 [Nitrospirillum amazonense Y2]
MLADGRAPPHHLGDTPSVGPLRALGAFNIAFKGLRHRLAPAKPGEHPRPNFGPMPA